MKMVKDKEADAFVSAGSSGAILVGGQVIVGRIKGVERPPLAPLIPTEKGVSLFARATAAPSWRCLCLPSATRFWLMSAKCDDFEVKLSRNRRSKQT